ncbi:MAG: hypothetical protein ACE5FA_05435 [Dehalococcoidia bacterium]
MISICVPYPPGEVRAVECDQIRWLRRETGEQELVCHQSEYGEWTISIKLPNGMFVDVASAGSGEKPEVNGGTVATIRSMSSAGESGALRRRILKERELAAKRQRRYMNEENFRYQELLARMRARAPGVSKDHPRFDILKR